MTEPKADRSLVVIHVILALLAPILIIAFTGCIEQENPVPVDYGPAVDPNEILSALNSPTKDMSPTTIKANEFKAFNVTQTIGLGQPQLTKIVGETITN